MNNPEFMKEMKRMMETPEMKAALAQVFQAGVHAQPVAIPESVVLNVGTDCPLRAQDRVIRITFRRTKCGLEDVSPLGLGVLRVGSKRKPCEQMGGKHGSENNCRPHSPRVPPRTRN